MDLLDIASHVILDRVEGHRAEQIFYMSIPSS